MIQPVAIGIDVGTSGARCVAMSVDLDIVAQAAAPMSRFGVNHRDPAAWAAAVDTSLTQLLSEIDSSQVRAIAVDGTSGTVLPVDGTGTPLAEPLMYNDAVPDTALLDRIAPLIPAESAAHGPISGLAKMLAFRHVEGVARMLHQADWIAGRLSGRFDVTDENNALKSGYDPVAGRWPAWMASTELDSALLPEVLSPGSPIGQISNAAASRLGLPEVVMIVVGTTDGCASFLATGASEPGDGVTALGSTLTLKLLSDRPIFAPQYGVYSHRILGMWLAGGASNTGGKILAHFFDGGSLERLSAAIDPASDSGLDYYPLLSPGERFPIMDPLHEPRLLPRPANDALFLQGMLEGIADIEQLGYRCLAELGAPALGSLRSVGGGAANPQWTVIRQRKLGVPFLPSLSEEAAAGSARLALVGARQAGIL